MRPNREDRVAVLQGANRRKSARARADVELGVSVLRKRGATINVNAVARESGVSRGFIYTHEDLRQLIAKASEESKVGMRRVAATPNEKSLTARLATALREIEKLKLAKKKLEDEKSELVARVENLTAQLFDQEARRR
ncbi:hypothetical protein F6W70_03700 [Microbacterium maritypicum]|uniref:Transposase n=1 Tax=Microbacterium maritypicum TaxID=33918 RepID=A0AAD3X3H2_MICMQ|nr:DUF6262 family protein [Microbacterium liquefaciens]KAB1886562.1 hypothetical protein F6W70_03700 [Microbacterium liquefaciens]